MEHYESVPLVKIKPCPPEGKNAGDILLEMVETYKNRSETYGGNFTQVRDLTRVLFPDGVLPEIVDKAHWYIFEIILGKIARFANSGLEHIDSVHDIAVYCAIIEEILSNKEKFK